jgi:RNA polymerase sigma-70 factor (ECF subfamily)
MLVFSNLERILGFGVGMDEAQIIRRAQAKDHEAFELLVKRYEGRIMALIRGMVKDPVDAQDIFQEVFLRVYMGLKNFRLESSFYTWVYRIAVNRCLTWFDAMGRREKLHLRPLDTDEEGDSWLERTISQQAIDLGVDEDPERERKLKKIWQAVETLKPKQRLIFCLRYQHGLQVKEISEIFDMPDGTVKILAFRAIRQIREQLQEFQS